MYPALPAQHEDDWDESALTWAPEGNLRGRRGETLRRAVENRRRETYLDGIHGALLLLHRRRTVMKGAVFRFSGLRGPHGPDEDNLI